MSGIGVSASGELTKKEKSMATVVTWVSPGSGTYWVTATITCIIIRRLKEGFLAGNLAMCRFYSKHLAMREYLCLRVTVYRLMLFMTRTEIKAIEEGVLRTRDAV